MNYLYKCLFPGLFLWFIPLISSGQVISGSVYSQQLGLPLSDVRVTVVGTALSGVTDFEGRFFISHFPLGESELLFEKSGFSPRTAVVEYERGQDTISIGISLCPLTGAYDRERQSVAWRRLRDNQKTPQSIASIEGSQFKEIQSGSIPLIASSLPGVSLQQSGFSSASPVIRGMSGRHILLLQDGLPLLPVTLGEGPNPWWLTVDPSMTSRMELMRGPGSIAYGNNATGGVISLQTAPLSFSDGRPQIHAEAGTRLQPGSRELGGHGGVSLHGNGISLGLRGYRRDLGTMPLSASSIQAAPGGYQSLGGEGQLALRIAPRHRLDIQIGHHQLTQDTTNSLPGQIRSTSLHRKQLSLGWTGHFDDPLWETIRLTVARQEFDQRMIRPVSLSGLPVDEEESLNTFRALLEIKSAPNWLWQAVSGVEVARHDVESMARIKPLDGPMEEVDPSIPSGAIQEEIGLYSLHTLDILKLRLAFGGRAQAQRVYWENPGFGQESWAPQALTGNISAMYPLTHGLEITSSFRTGFRNPGLADLRGGYPLSTTDVLLPSDSLGAERTFSTEIGLKANNSFFSGSLILYHAQMDDWIRQVASQYQGSPVWQGMNVIQHRNMDQRFVQGVEAEVEVPVYKKIASVYGSIAYTHGINVSQSDYLTAIPPLNSRLGLRYNPGYGFWTRVEWRHASTQRQLSLADLQLPYQSPTGTASWNVIDLHVGYDFRWGYLMLGLENMLDARYRIHGSAIESPGRLLIFSMQIGF